MDGGTGQEPADELDDVERRWLTRRSQAAADAGVLAGAPFLADAVDRLRSAITDLLDVRWGAASPDELRAAIRCLAGEQARLDAAVLGPVRALDGHDDGRSRPGAQSVAAGFLQHGLGVERHRARREAVAAALLDRDAGDLRVVGAALAAGEISREHADIAARVHERLGATVREVLVDGEDGVRCIDLVDATLARHARALTVPELRRVADRIVEHLHPPTPDGAHERRYLNVSTLPDGSLIGRFACGPAQGLVLLAAIAAGAEPRPGLCVDADGVERSLPDGRSAAQRRMDALAERLEEAVRAPGTGPRAPSETPAERLGEVGAFQETPSQTQGVAPGAEGCPLEPEPEAEPKTEPEPEPEPEGEIEVRRRPGERAGPAADVEIVVVATLDQLAVALALDRDNREPPSAAGLKGGSPPDVGTSFERGRGLPAGFARDRLGTPVHPKTLGLLACSSRLRRVLVDENGAVLDLGRARRLATAAQRRALLARDVGCVVPGCDISGAFCEVHHPTPWRDGGRTDIAGLALLCPRHHTEVHEGGGWDIEMVNGVPWVRPPSWVDPERPLLRNLAHRTAA